ncbi:DEAD/DEAH box helicase [Ammoniphilus sp. CFH 90114]|uniref:DEAD/DEAH box helicase n=1 Tax=Ammoniphilus sp. CFH 90114 TaxID=2493665 RepID=UPI00100F2ACC|nr:DEAD/DEAH box helicase [Ammoniphilus sp. CFH 90114]RXT15420.1 DEAD/DEAH box helicase [Ammoniphilus sp. CFH 90114]
MMKADKIIIYSRWVPHTGHLIWARNQGGYPLDVLELKTRLFSWHEPSFYGTFLETKDGEGWEGVLLSPKMSLDYFCNPSPLVHQQLEWSQETEQILELAPLLEQAITEKTYKPNFSLWQKGEWGWTFPISEESLLPYTQDWAEILLKQEGMDMIHHPLLRSEAEQREHWTEEEWLIAIGWKEDPVPFRIALKLLEPTGNESWSLQLVLQDPTHQDLHYAYPFVLSDIPSDWIPFIVQVDRYLERLVTLLPWFHIDYLSRELEDQEAWFFLSEGSRMLVEAGFIVLLPSWWSQLEKRKPRLVARVQSSVTQSELGLDQLMRFDWKLSVGDITLSEEQFLEVMKQKKQLIRVNGKWIQLDASVLERLHKLMRELQNKEGLTLGQILESHFQQEDTEHPTDIQVELNSSLLTMLQQLQEISTLPIVTPPASLQATLRPYQMEGYSWLLFLRRFGLGGCLADDMGLGKTIQWISYLLYLKENEPLKEPSLLICPTSVLGNWQKELRRFAPSLKVYIHYGGARKKGEEFSVVVHNADIVLTTYNLSHLDSDELQSVKWNAIGLDEAQNIKNVYTKQAAAVRQLSGRHRVAMTGTPIENRLTELWSIFDFINPGYLGSLRDFTRRFVNPIEKEKDKELIRQIQRMIRPFLLRRVKTDPKIQLNLPEKFESKEYLSLTVEQASLYEVVLQELFSKIELVSPMERRGIILASLTKLKQICNHPDLFLKADNKKSTIDFSPKVERLLQMVEELRQEGDKCLIFTQYVEMGNILKNTLEQELNESVQFLHGGTPREKRDEMILRFQDESLSNENQTNIFILSLKAGGIGLNLTAANHVFHIDRWWNPAVESQATDRAYRIGQTRRVQVHKFITLGTLEEKIDDMMERKLGLSEQIVGSSEQWITELSQDDLKELLTLHKEWVT